MYQNRRTPLQHTPSLATSGAPRPPHATPARPPMLDRADAEGIPPFSSTPATGSSRTPLPRPSAISRGRSFPTPTPVQLFMAGTGYEIVAFIMANYFHNWDLEEIVHNLNTLAHQYRLGAMPVPPVVARASSAEEQFALAVEYVGRNLIDTFGRWSARDSDAMRLARELLALAEGVRPGHPLPTLPPPIIPTQSHRPDRTTDPAHTPSGAAENIHICSTRTPAPPQSGRPRPPTVEPTQIFDGARTSSDSMRRTLVIGSGRDYVATLAVVDDLEIHTLELLLPIQPDDLNFVSIGHLQMAKKHLYWKCVESFCIRHLSSTAAGAAVENSLTVLQNEIYRRGESGTSGNPSHHTAPAETWLSLFDATQDNDARGGAGLHTAPGAQNDQDNYTAASTQAPREQNRQGQSTEAAGLFDELFPDERSPDGTKDGESKVSAGFIFSGILDQDRDKPITPEERERAAKHFLARFANNGDGFTELYKTIARDIWDGQRDYLVVEQRRLDHVYNVEIRNSRAQFEHLPSDGHSCIGKSNARVEPAIATEEASSSHPSAHPRQDRNESQRSRDSAEHHRGSDFSDPVEALFRELRENSRDERSTTATTAKASKDTAGGENQKGKDKAPHNTAPSLENQTIYGFMNKHPAMRREGTSASNPDTPEHQARQSDEPRQAWLEAWHDKMAELQGKGRAESTRKQSATSRQSAGKASAAGNGAATNASGTSAPPLAPSPVARSDSFEDVGVPSAASSPPLQFAVRHGEKGRGDVAEGAGAGAGADGDLEARAGSSETVENGSVESIGGNEEKTGAAGKSVKGRQKGKVV